VQVREKVDYKTLECQRLKKERSKRMLKGKRKKLDKNKDGKLSSIDFAMLRKKKKKVKKNVKKRK
jgi:hypothetical protein|tara:strand:+ start:466 stop:660 length:195 start_codon:yes stop_codon:yes gene_type:complete